MILHICPALLNDAVGRFLRQGVFYNIINAIGHVLSFFSLPSEPAINLKKGERAITFVKDVLAPEEAVVGQSELCKQCCGEIGVATNLVECCTLERVKERLALYKHRNLMIIKRLQPIVHI